MSNFELSADEARLVRAIEDAEPAIFAPGGDGAPTAIIRADAIRRLFLGVTVSFPVEGTSRVAKLHSQGIHLVGVRIEGPLSLDDMSGRDGAPIPPLVLRNCVIPMPITLTRARLQHLSLSDCKIKHLVADGAHIVGSVVLAGLQSAETARECSGANGEGRCWV